MTSPALKLLSKRPKSIKLLAAVGLLILVAAFWWLFSPKVPALPTPTQTVSQKESIDEKKALKIVTEQEDVKNYLKEVPGAKIALDHFDQDSNSYVFQVFEVKNEHTNTFNWYEVNKASGELKPLFP